MVQLVKALAALAEDRGWLPALTQCSSQLPVTPVPGDLVPSSGLLGIRIHMHILTHSHKNKTSVSLQF